LRAVYKSVSLL